MNAERMVICRELLLARRLLGHSFHSARFGYSGLRFQSSVVAVECKISSSDAADSARKTPGDFLPEDGRVGDLVVGEILREASQEQREIKENARSSSSKKYGEVSIDQKLVEQAFDYFVVIDFEATCDSTVFFPQEIIEFPSVLVAVHSLSVEDSFQTYVKPTFNPQLTDFCKRLTGIEQTQVDNGMALAEALVKHDKWLEDKGVKSKRFGVITWTDWDCKVMLDFECRLKGLTKPSYFNKWINLKSCFQEKFGDKFNLKKAVQHAGLQWQGREHCGLDDAKNTASLAMELVRRGMQIGFTQHQSSRKPAITNISSEFMPKLKKILEALPRSSDIDETSITVGADNLCYCGVKCKTRLVRKAGPNQGKFFLSCGNWTLTEGGKCTYFEWMNPPEQHSPSPAKS
ncbi:3'-5' exoribonuclease 1 [Selaginella moellendorffii]|nr:3'-5' exoribonuclease 1 [Selaginella moellendorffii]|eukprot:XP_002960949.2 3'-5' exoribonuclease 1 [Selaginella moellendorffii]